MTTITINDVQRLASLSSLHLSDDEAQALQWLQAQGYSAAWEAEAVASVA